MKSTQDTGRVTKVAQLPWLMTRARRMLDSSMEPSSTFTSIGSTATRTKAARAWRKNVATPASWAAWAVRRWLRSSVS